MNDKTFNSSSDFSGKGVLDEFLNPSLPPEVSRNNQATTGHENPYNATTGPYELAEKTSGGECYLEYQTELRMLDLRQVNGSFTALPYHYLETVDFLPSEGIVLTYPMCKVKITGYRLHAIYRALTGFRVSYIQALGNHFMPLGGMESDGEDGEPVVEGIAIETSRGPEALEPGEA
ncbi:MAG: hypothetical protein AAGH88_03300 [Planctomycetota bacterium]